MHRGMQLVRKGGLHVAQETRQRRALSVHLSPQRGAVQLTALQSESHEFSGGRAVVEAACHTVVANDNDGAVVRLRFRFRVLLRCCGC